MPGVQELFPYVLFAVVAVAAVVALLTLRGPRYDHIGRDGLFEERPRAREPTGAVAMAERDEEVRQMLRARNARRAARGQAQVDVEAELARLTAPAVDPALRAEIRGLVEARNARRARQGKPPLDVEAEIDRQLRDLGQG